MEISPDIEDKVLDEFKLVIYNKEKDEDDGICDRIFNCICCCLRSSSAPDAKNSDIQGLKTVPSPKSPKTPGSKNDSSDDTTSLDEYAKELKKKYKFKKPEICGEFVSVAENRHPWYKQEKIVEKKEQQIIELPEPVFDYTPYVVSKFQ